MKPQALNVQVNQNRRQGKYLRDKIEITIWLERMPPINEEESNGELKEKSGIKEIKTNLTEQKGDGYDADTDNDETVSTNDEENDGDQSDGETQNFYKELTLEDLETSIIDEENYCIICTAEFDKQDISTVLCGHKFCKDCIDGWLLIDRDNCPICGTFLGDEAEDEDERKTCKTCFFRQKAEEYEEKEETAKIIEQYRKVDELYELENGSDTDIEEKAEKIIDPADQIQQEIIKDIIEMKRKNRAYENILKEKDVERKQESFEEGQVVILKYHNGNGVEFNWMKSGKIVKKLKDQIYLVAGMAGTEPLRIHESWLANVRSEMEETESDKENLEPSTQKEKF
jgi:hypothetical protein